MGNQLKKIGFIGLGIMGKRMAINLINAGYRLAVYDSMY
jgi:3-hydroxyisobutyrate dehydrogenase-like beta-hydroxyacid dehydrogenase